MFKKIDKFPTNLDLSKAECGIVISEKGEDDIKRNMPCQDVFDIITKEYKNIRALIRIKKFIASYQRTKMKMVIIYIKNVIWLTIMKHKDIL